MLIYISQNYMCVTKLLEIKGQNSILKTVPAINEDSRDCAMRSLSLNSERGIFFRERSLDYSSFYDE